MTTIFITLILGAALPQFDAQTLDGHTLAGNLIELSADKATLGTAQGRVSLETENILALAAIEPAKEAEKLPIVVELTDGSTVFARNYVVRDGKARITLADGEAVEAPISAVQSVRFHGDEPKADEWTRLIETKADSDLLVIRVDKSIDSHKGVIHDVTPDIVGFDLDGEILPVKRTKVYGFIYRHGVTDAPPPATCRITDSNGSRWVASSVSLNGKLQWVTPSGLTVSQPLESIVRMDFSCGKMTYLSDLDPDSTDWTPFFGTKRRMPSLQQFYAPRFDCGFGSDALSLGGNVFRKGLALNARTELVYRLPEGFSRFRAIVGIDDAVLPGGRVRLVIRGDDQVLLETDVSGKDLPQPIELNVAGVRRLTIIVDYGDELSAGDRILMCNARIVK